MATGSEGFLCCRSDGKRDLGFILENIYFPTVVCISCACKRPLVKRGHLHQLHVGSENQLGSFARLVNALNC